MRLGVHYPNSPDTTPALAVSESLLAESAKLLHTEGTQHTQADLDALVEKGVQHFTVRLRDSLYTADDGSKFIPSDARYASDLLRDIVLWSSRGVKQFQICNEPNWLYPTSTFGPSDYVWFMKRVMRLLQQALQDSGVGDVILCAPPLSWSPALWHHGPENPTAWTLDEWTDAFSAARHDAEEENDRVPFWDFFHKVCANVYWQKAGEVRNPSYGASWYELYVRSHGKHVVVTELGQTANRLRRSDQKTPLYTAYQVFEQRRVQYREWVYWAGGSGIVDDAYFWIAPRATHEWLAEEISRELASAVIDPKDRKQSRRRNGRSEI